MNKLKILVACHKAVEVFENDVYVPIHVGKALHPNLELGFISDNIGDNISMKNPFYSELTAQYWAWKISIPNMLDYVTIEDILLQNILIIT